jgi:ribosomal protein L35AE/L33A
MMQVEREGLILNYRLGRKTQYPKMCLIKVLDVGPSDSKQMIGWKVGWPARNGIDSVSKKRIVELLNEGKMYDRFQLRCRFLDPLNDYIYAGDISRV